MGVKLEVGLGPSDGIEQVSEAPIIHVCASKNGEGISLPLILHPCYDVEGDLLDVRSHDSDGPAHDAHHVTGMDGRAIDCY